MVDPSHGGQDQVKFSNYTSCSFSPQTQTICLKVKISTFRVRLRMENRDVGWEVSFLLQPAGEGRVSGHKDK